MAPDLARSWEISRPTSPSLPTVTGSSYSLPSRVRRPGAGAGETAGDSSMTGLLCWDILKAPRAHGPPKRRAPSEILSPGFGDAQGNAPRLKPLARAEVPVDRRPRRDQFSGLG